MPKTIPIRRLLVPIHEIIGRILQEFALEELSDHAARAKIVSIADTTLLIEYPSARALPSALRHRVIVQIVENLVPSKRSTGKTTVLIKTTASSLRLTREDKAMLRSSAPGNSVRAFMIDSASGEQPAVESAVGVILGKGWKATRMDKRLKTYRVTNPTAILSVPDAWEFSHAFEGHPEIDRAEPEIEWVPAPPEIGGHPPDVLSNLQFSAGAPSMLECAKDKDWHIRGVNGYEAWEISRKAGRPLKGQGVTIGHLDTGVTDHDEVPVSSPGILVSKGKNLYDPEDSKYGSKPLDPMDSNLWDVLALKFKTFDGHGTGTSSIITGKSQLTGSAPNAKLIPFRVAPTVVHFNLTRMTEAIRLAHEAGCDVITMSMGGIPPRTSYLQEIIARAVEDGVIICTAAGNGIGSNDLMPAVVWPAAMDQVIAVAGCNCRNLPWSGSSRGPEVNICAFAQEVWRAEAQSGKGGKGSIAQGNGTSFATPTVAGMAACWLAHHGGRAALAKHYGHARYVPQAFAWLLRKEAVQKQPNWRTDLMGPGILDAEKLLAAKLPPKSELDGWPVKKHSGLGNGIKDVIGAPLAASAPESAGGELAYLLFDRPVAIAPLVENLKANRVTAAPLGAKPPSATAKAAADLAVTRAEAGNAARRSGMSPRLASLLAP